MPSWCYSVIFSIALIAMSYAKTLAGGFDRFDQGVDLLFDPASIVFNATGAYVFTSRAYNSVNGQKESVRLLADFSQASFNLKFTPTEKTACLLAARQPFGTDGDHGPSWSQAAIIVAQKLRINELSLTCSAKANWGLGFVRGIAGASREFARFDQSAIDSRGPAGPINSNIGFYGEAWSWRAGLAYEIPSAAVVASIIYYAPMSFGLHGTFDQITTGNGNFLTSVPIRGDTNFPQAVEGSLQGAVAPGWLLGASIKWMDWSALDHVQLRTAATASSLPENSTIADFKTFFRDGLTVGLFAAHQIDSNLSIAAKVLWDRGVATGWTEHTSSWAVSGGAQYRLNENFDVSVGAAFVSLTGGAINKRNEGAPYDATFGTGFAIVPRVGVTARY